MANQTLNNNSANDASKNKRNGWLKKILSYGVPLVISIGLCWLLFAKQDFGTMIDTIRERCNWTPIWIVLVMSTMSHVIRAMRWRIQLQAIGVKVGLYPVVLSIFGTYAVNLVFPRLGELWRTTYISQRQDAPFDKVFGSMVADRLADTVTVGLLTVITFGLAGGQLTEYLSGGKATFESLMQMLYSPWLWAGVAVVIALACFLFFRCRQNKLVKTVVDFCCGIWNGFSVIGSMPHRGRWLLLTVAIWACYYSQLLVAFYAFPETALFVERHGALAVLVCFVFSSLSMGVPSNGGIGPWQWAVIFGISLYSFDVPGLTNEVATSFANLVMGMQTLLLIILGLFTFASIAVGRKRRLPN